MGLLNFQLPGRQTLVWISRVHFLFCWRGRITVGRSKTEEGVHLLESLAFFGQIIPLWFCFNFSKELCSLRNPHKGTHQHVHVRKRKLYQNKEHRRMKLESSSKRKGGNRSGRHRASELRRHDYLLAAGTGQSPQTSAGAMWPPMSYVVPRYSQSSSLEHCKASLALYD